MNVFRHVEAKITAALKGLMTSGVLPAELDLVGVGYIDTVIVGGHPHRAVGSDGQTFNLVEDTKTYTLTPTVSSTTYAARIDELDEDEVRWNTSTGVRGSW